MNAKDRALARWPGAPRGCQHRWRGLKCNRDANHPGRHFDPDASPGGGYWGAEFRDHDGTPEPRTQFCDLDWQDRFDKNPAAPAFYFAYEVAEDTLLTVGPLGMIHMNKEQYPKVVAKLRKWASGLEKYMKDYEEEDDD